MTKKSESKGPIIAAVIISVIVIICVILICIFVPLGKKMAAIKNTPPKTFKNKPIEHLVVSSPNDFFSDFDIEFKLATTQAPNFLNLCEIWVKIEGDPNPICYLVLYKYESPNKQMIFELAHSQCFEALKVDNDNGQIGTWRIKQKQNHFMMIHNDIASPSITCSKPLPKNINEIRLKIGHEHAVISSASIKYNSNSFNFDSQQFTDSNK